MKYRLNRKFSKDKELKRKMELEKEREIFGKDWLEKQKKNKEKELNEYVEHYNKEKNKIDKEEIKTEEKVDILQPKLFDCVDISEFFKPIEAFKDMFGKDYKLYLKKYEEFPKIYKDELLKINNKMYSNTLEDKIEEDSENSVEYNKNLKKLNEVKDNFYKDAFSNIESYVPIYNKYVCNCCGKIKDIQDYFISFNMNSLSKIDANGNIRMSVCKDCTKKLFNYYYLKRAEKDGEKAMKMLCASLNLYWDISLFYLALKNMEQNKNIRHIVEEYIEVINFNPLSIGKTFCESPFLQNNYSSDIKAKNDTLKVTDQEEQLRGLSIDEINVANILDWDKRDLKNRRSVIKLVGYDVFSYESEENRKQLYSDLLGMLEPGMEQDSVKLQAAIQIVTSFLKVREMNEKYKEMQINNAPLSDLKTLADLKQKELTAITRFSQDNGFSERFSTAKAKGENTFTGILNKMNEDKFENAILNRYDIETSETIQQAANASFKAIFEQLSLGETDVWKIAQDQLAELLKLRKELKDTKETLRITRYNLSKVQLQQKAMEAGISLDKDDEEYEEDLEFLDNLRKERDSKDNKFIDTQDEEYVNEEYVEDEED